MNNSLNQILTLLYVLFFLLSCKESIPLFPKGLASVKTGWEGKRSLSSKECKSCHEKVTHEWQEGMHAKAWTDPIFQEAFKIEPREWCVNCHAPLQLQKDEFISLLKSRPYKNESLLNEGITCVSCHVREGKVLGFNKSKNEAHEVIQFDYLSSSEFCENCHQFNFPEFKDGKVHYTKEPMQNTYQEWKSTRMNRNCQFCHYDGHRLVGIHDKDKLKSDFSDFEYEMTGKSLLSISFSIEERIGHILPTGDLFHSIAFEGSTTPDFKKIFYQKKWGRNYTIGQYEANSFWNRKLKRNDGLKPEQKRINLTFDLPGSKEIYLRLIYYYHDEALGGKNNLPLEKRQVTIWESKVQ